MDVMFFLGFMCGIVAACVLALAFEAIFEWMWPDPPEQPRKHYRDRE